MPSRATNASPAATGTNGDRATSCDSRCALRSLTILLGRYSMTVRSLSRRTLLGTTAAATAFAALPLRPSAAQSTKVLKSRAPNDVTVIDPPNRASDVNESVAACLFGGLVKRKPGEWAWELDLAVSVEQVDPTHVKFQLKPGIPWSDGFGEVTAEDVKYSYERIADPEFHAQYRTDWEALDRVDVTDPRSGVIVLKKPYLPLWSVSLPSASGLIVCKQAVEKLEGKKFTSSPPAVCGPYRIQKFEPKRVIVLERNPLWPGRKPVFDEIHFLSIIDSNAAEIAYQAGEIDFTHVPGTSVPRLKKVLPGNTTLLIRPSLNYWWLGMQSEDGVFADVRVRKAVQLAVDVGEVMEGAFFGVAEPSNGIIAPGTLVHGD